MVSPSFTPWHQVVALRADLKSGELPLSSFAADLYDVAMQRGRATYRDPREFFALTYPTFNLRELAKDVLQRLDGKNDKAVRQLELTYGGGKTHSLITLFHLVREPEALPDVPAVHEFRQHAGGGPLPKARVAVLAFDKLDVEKGMEVLDPQGGAPRWLKHPWSVLAYQLAGSRGLQLLHADGTDAERETPPAENLLDDLLSIPQEEGLATLILMDEVLMYAREKTSLDPVWRYRLQDFFQYLTQAATKVDRACIVASLLATDPRKSDNLGKEIIQELYATFRREKEEGVQPVEKEDVAEVLRRRFFTPESIRDRDRFQSHVVAALDGIQALDEWTQKNRRSEEERYLASYPFHPDLTEALYTKWTQLEGFQRTRGVLRTFALALRDAEPWDTAPLVGAGVLLQAPGKLGLSEAARELTSVAGSEEYEGKRQEWSAILQGELEKAAAVQEEFPALQGRELEEAVVATFLHSQPAGQRALTRELQVLLGATKPDRIELEKALRQWTEVSWFLDEAAFSDLGSSGELPKSWRLGTKPNLKQMHSQALTRVPPDLIEMTMRDMIGKERRLTGGASQAGARVHNLPARPRDVDDDGEFHYVVLDPRAVSEAGKPSPEARRFLEETTGADRPRVYRNAVLLVAPSREGLELLQSRVRDHLAWKEVETLPESLAFDDVRKTLLKGYTEQTRQNIPDAIVQAFGIVVTVGAKGDIEAFRIAPGNEPLFETIKKDKRSRIQESAISPEALLPDGPYDLWRSGETARRGSDLIQAFAQFPHLPKMIRRSDIVDTLALGCEQGYFVLRVPRPDRSVRTIWRARPSETDLTERDLEVLLPEAAELTELDARLLGVGKLPGLWPDGDTSITFSALKAFFDGRHVAKIPRQGYEEAIAIPKAQQDVVTQAVNAAVPQGVLWLVSGPTSIYREDVPLGALTDAATLAVPPEEIPPTALLPQNLASAWERNETTAAALAAALATDRGVPLPWYTVSRAIDSAFRARLLERDVDSGGWPCDWVSATGLRIRVATPTTTASGQMPLQPTFTTPRHFAEADMEPSELQDLVDSLSEILKAGAGLNLRFVLRIEAGDGADASADQLRQLRDALRKANEKLAFE